MPHISRFLSDFLSIGILQVGVLSNPEVLLGDIVLTILAKRPHESS